MNTPYRLPGKSRALGLLDGKNEAVVPEDGSVPPFDPTNYLKTMTDMKAAMLAAKAERDAMKKELDELRPLKQAIFTTAMETGKDEHFLNRPESMTHSMLMVHTARDPVRMGFVVHVVINPAKLTIRITDEEIAGRGYAETARAIDYYARTLAEEMLKAMPDRMDVNVDVNVKRRSP